MDPGEGKAAGEEGEEVFEEGVEEGYEEGWRQKLQESIYTIGILVVDSSTYLSCCIDSNLAIIRDVIHCIMLYLLGF